MRPIALATILFVLSLATQQPHPALAQVGQTSPDYDLAYKLATASYCAYAVGEADADAGGKRTVECLKAAANSDGARLAAFRDMTQDNVEAYYNPDAPENAYLLIQNADGVILAFRGTLTPPLSPSSGRFPAAVAEALAKYKAREATLLETFITDWKHNFRAIPDARGRHSGFDDAWSGLQDHLMGKKCVPACSKFLSFVSPLRNTTSKRLYITGHSKGGALAVLAALDLSDITPVVYTFAGAKALTANAAKQHGDAFKDTWRFEHEDDVVPDVPPDRTVLPVPAYAHVGSRAFFAKGQQPQLSPVSEQGVDAPGDLGRLTVAVRKMFPSDAPSLNPLNVAASILNLGAVDCEALVDNHFGVLADVQERVHAGAPMPITEGNLKQSFFFTGLPDSGGDILWGYSQWCRLLTAASAK